MREQESLGATCVALAVVHCLVGTFSIKDPLKPEAVGVVAALHNMGMQCHLVTGDNWLTAKDIRCAARHQQRHGRSFTSWQG